MKIQVKIDPSLEEDEITIMSATMSDAVMDTIAYLKEQAAKSTILSLMDEEHEYFIPSHRILFFETLGDRVMAHLDHQTLQTKLRLYELEQSLSKKFLRISKSAIVNIDHVYAIERKLSTNCVYFQNSDKIVYVSRRYFATLKQKLIERSAS